MAKLRRIIWINIFASLAKGAGLRWRPLHFNAEAPTEPGGETVGATCCTRRDWKYGKDIESLPYLALSVFCSGEWIVQSTRDTWLQIHLWIWEKQYSVLFRSKWIALFIYKRIKRKSPQAIWSLRRRKSALLIFPAGCPASIFSANELNYRVRDGNGWTLVAINTDAWYIIITNSKSQHYSLNSL